MLSKTLWMVASLSAVLAAGCATTPYTERKQLMLVSEVNEDEMGEAAYQDVVKKSKISQDAAANATLKQAGNRIAKAADKPSYKWQFTLIDDPKMVNAFCLPGGRVAFYTGILPITKDENGVAVVMSHEIAHALARHGAERISDQMAAGLATQVAVSAGLIQSQAALQNVQMAYGLTRGLPHSRKQEAEADRIGLILMAKAGYDPRAAVDFWQRMAQHSEGKAPPEFLSSHPSDEHRIKKIKEELPEALAYYKP